MHTFRIQIGLTITLMVVALLICLQQTTASAQNRGGTVVGVAGSATLFRDGTTSPVVEGMAVSAGDRILTDDDARVAIALGEGGRAVLGGATAAVLRFFNTKPGGGRSGLFELLRGILRVALRPGPDTAVEVTTQTAIASVRSTEWIVDANAATTGIFALTGTVVVTGRTDGAQVTLRPGEGSDVPAGGSPTPAKRWGEARIQAALSRTQGP